MTEVREGGCLCGAIRLRASGPAARMTVCHCTDCQKVSGGAPSYLWGASAENFAVTKGEPASFTVTGASGKPVTRFFCRDCGAPLHSIPEVYEGVVYVKLGAFDAPPDFVPQASVWTRSAPAWHVVADGPAFETVPQR